MKRLIQLLLLSTVAATAQYTIPASSGAAATTATPAPSFSSYFFVYATGSSSASVTSGSVTVPNNSVVYLMCSSGNGSSQTGFTGSSTLSATWHSDAFMAGDSFHFAAGMESASFTTGGTGTFTCTPSASASSQEIVGLIYTGSTATKNASVVGTGQNTTLTLSGLTTSQKTLTLLCTRQGSSGNTTWTAGSVGGAGATLVAFDSVGNGTGQTACEAVALTGAVTAASGAVTMNSNNFWTGILVSYNY